jgi:hypothetical protein
LNGKIAAHKRQTMKYILIVMFLSSYLCLSPVETIKNEILIKYSSSQNGFYLFAINPQDKPDKIKSVNTITAFCNDQNNRLNIEVYARIGFLKIVSITSGSNSYMEINYDNQANFLFLDSLLGEFDITSYNSHIQTVTRIADTSITNFASSYKIISYPDKNIFIKIVEGKINVKNDRESILLITGESCEISGKNVILSEIKDSETSRLILNNRLFSQYDRTVIDNEISMNTSFERKINDNYNLISPVKFNNLENIFSETLFNNGNFGYELEYRIKNNPSFWNKVLKIYPVRH